jgi:ABC-2 type transport system permease protein
MRADIATVMWKEWRSLSGGRARRQVFLTGGMLALWAVIFPIQMGADWVSDPVPMAIMGVVLPTIVAGVIIPEAIAGERERHTLSTLLASRLPDRAILLGKLAFAVGFAWLTAPIVLAIALIVVNVVAGQGALLLYDPGVLVGVLVAGFLGALLTGGIGIFISLRASTAQEAQQLTVMSVMLPFMLIGVGFTVLISNRELARSAIDWLGSQDARLVAVAAMAVFAFIDALILLAADRRFRRSRLVIR